MNRLAQHTLHVGDQKFVCLPSKLLWSPDDATLFMADSHFGKASSFRRAGLPVPEGTTSKMLTTLGAAVEELGAQHLVVLGDLCHSVTSAQRDFEQDLFHWREKFRLKMTLVRGNHDRRAAAFYNELGIQLAQHDELRWGEVTLCHDPANAKQEKFAICGHVHPAVQVADLTLPCFWIRSNQLILPAYGQFTGTHKVTLSKGETAILVYENELAVIHGPSRK